MSYTRPVTSPNLEKLFSYLRKSSWHNVTSNFTSCVRREYLANMKKLEESNQYQDLKLLIEFSDMGKFSEAKGLVDNATKEYEDMMSKLQGFQRIDRRKESPNRQAGPSAHTDNVHSERRDGDFTGRRETYTPDKRNVASPADRNITTPDRHVPPPSRGYGSQNRHQSPNRQAGPPAHTDNVHSERRDGDFTGRRETYTPDKRNVASPADRNITTPDRHVPPPSRGYGSQNRHQGMHERRPLSPPYHTDRSSYDHHVENFESMRINSQESPSNQQDHHEQQQQHQQHQQNRFDPPRAASPEDRGSRPRVMTSANQMASSQALWGHDHGDKPAEKIGSSTYRQEFPSYSVDTPERKDKERYRENFGSLNERDLYREREDAHSQRGDTSRKGSSQQRHSEIPNVDYRPSEICRKFKDVYTNEWADAYDEICKELGSEKTVQYLLWIVTEASLIANETADRQLYGLEKQAFEVMTSPPPGDENEAWAIAMDVAEKQIKDFEKSALSLMTTPGVEHRGGYMPRQLGDTLPTSRNLLQQYRKQTSLLSIPYLKEEIRDKISKSLESCGFSKLYLSDASRLTAYINKCAELVWLMCVQDPPIVLQYVNRESEGARFNYEHYNVYTKAGNVYDYGVWPMLRQGRNGTILSKGVAQGI